jgi:hypothetical protein
MIQFVKEGWQSSNATQKIAAKICARIFGTTFLDDFYFKLIVFPLLHNRPWQLKGTPKMFYLAHQVHKMFQRQDLGPREIFARTFIGVS